MPWSASRSRPAYKSHFLGRRGPYAHLDSPNLDARFDQPLASGKPSRYQEWLRRMYEAQQRSRDDFVEHFRAKYDGRLPAWVVTEMLNFAGLSTLYSGPKRRDRDDIAADFGALDGKGRGNGAALPNWLRVITTRATPVPATRGCGTEHGRPARHGSPASDRPSGAPAQRADDQGLPGLRTLCLLIFILAEVVATTGGIGGAAIS